MSVKLKFIQILRGFAAMAVLLFHLDGASLNHFNHVFFNFSYGYLGVDFFFALSGFIITYIHTRDIQQHGSVTRFLGKRFVRIFPFYWLILVVAIVQQTPDFIDKPALKNIFNIYTPEGWTLIIKNIFLLPLPVGLMPLGVAWSLTYEIFFYAVFAICIAGGWKFTKYLVSLWLLFIFLNSRDVFPKSEWTEAIAGNLVIEFLAGCAVGYLFVKGREFRSRLLLPALIVVAALFWLYLSVRSFNRSALPVTMLIGAISALIIFYAATLDKHKRSSALALPVLVLIGDASYSIYLTHTLYTSYLCDLFNNITHVSALATGWINIIIIIIFVLSVAIGVWLHLLIEKPLLNYLRNKFDLKKKKPALKPEMQLP